VPASTGTVTSRPGPAPPQTGPATGVPGSAATTSAGRPIMLITFFGAPFSDRACQLAVGSAIESGQQLIVANIVELPPLPMSVRLGHDHLDDPPEVDSALRAPAELAASIGVRVERLLVKSPRPIAALIQLAAERRPGLVIFGTEPGRLSRRFAQRAWRTLRDRADCLVWRAGDDEPPGAPGQPAG
jgi:nucleotide-binding universal stress UspA family protein